MPVWNLEIRSHSSDISKAVIIVHAPYTEAWRVAARQAGGRYKNPFFDVQAWQFETNVLNTNQLRFKLEKLLASIYPNQDGKDTNMSGTIDLTRRPTVPNLPKFASLPTPSQFTAEAPSKEPPKAESTVQLTSQQIAEVVSKIVTKRVIAQGEELKAQVHNSLDIAERTVAETVAAVNKRLDQVLTPTNITLYQSDGTKIETLNEITHFQFQELLDLCDMLSVERRNIWITGPAGSGKTTAARQIAKCLNRPFYFNGSIDTEYKLSGFIDAQGRIVSTAFRKAWEEGGVYLFDECDGSMASALLAFNAALANGHASFPDKVVSRHPDTVVLAAANTYGWGGTSNYVGRAKLDGAFLDRFSYQPWEYDERLERAVAWSSGQNTQVVNSWVDAVQSTRKLVFEKQAQVIVSPRRSIDGAELLSKGMARERVVRSQFSGLMQHSAWNILSKHLVAFRGGV